MNACSFKLLFLWPFLMDFKSLFQFSSNMKLFHLPSLFPKIPSLFHLSKKSWSYDGLNISDPQFPISWVSLVFALFCHLFTTWPFHTHATLPSMTFMTEQHTFFMHAHDAPNWPNMEMFHFPFLLFPLSPKPHEFWPHSTPFQLP